MTIRAFALSIGASIALSACVAGPPPNIATTAPDLPLSFAYAPDEAVSTSVENLLPNNDKAFAILSRVAQDGSPTLAEASARIDAARARATGTGANRSPSIGAGGSADFQRTNPAQFGAGLPPGIQFDNERVSYSATLSASWDPDLFGRLRAQERAALAQLDAAGADAAGVRLALIAEVAGAVIDWRTLTARERTLKEDLVAAESLVTLADIRERAGIAPGFDKVRAETSAEGSRSRIALLGSERAQIVGRLVSLTALSAQNVRTALTEASTNSDAPPVPASLPSQLLANRPDVQASAARLAASDAELYAAAAQRFPQFTLSAALGLLAFDLGDLFDGSSVVGSASGSLLAPLLDFGRIQAEIDVAAANKRAAFQAYRGQVFNALGEAETAYGLVAASDRQLTLAVRERDSANRAAELAEVRFRAGLSDFLTVLEARRSADASGERAAAASGRAARSRVLLWQALGGGNQAMTRSTSQ